MAETNSRAWWEDRGLDYLDKNDFRIRTEEDGMAAKQVLGMVIEVGCAFGGFTEALDQEVKYVGIDVAETMISKARELHPGWIFLRQDLAEASGFWKKTFDTACAFQLIEHFEDVKKPLEWLAKIARKRIVFTVPRGLPQNHQRKNDGHLVGWEDEDVVEKAFDGFGPLSFWKGNENHICGVIDLRG